MPHLPHVPHVPHVAVFEHHSLMRRGLESLLSSSPLCHLAALLAEPGGPGSADLRVDAVVYGPPENQVRGLAQGVRRLAAHGRVLVVSTVMLSFISYWRTAAVVLCDLASTSFYIGGIVESQVGKAAPWFILAVMLFSYAVRSVYIESCTMFVRGGVYRVVKQAMGGVAASFASLGDLVFAEPKALIGFAGPRTIKATIRVELPEGFQTSEFLLEHGYIDRIVRRGDLKSEIARAIDYCGK